MRWKVVHGDCLDVLKRLPANSVDSWVTDPPAAIDFMGKGWDRFTRREFIKFMYRVAREVLRVLKPGGHGLVWSLPRTRHLTTIGLEEAGFEIRDDISHLFASGFPKNHDIAKGVQKLQGVEPVGEKPPSLGMANNPQWNALHRQLIMPEPEGDAARFRGWGTALKPAREDWIMVRKPLEGTIARNALKYDTGGINIDGCRVSAGGPSPSIARRASAERSGNAPGKPGREGFRDRTTPERYIEERQGEQLGRWPSHVILSHGPECRLVGTREVSTGVAVRRNGRGGQFFGGIAPGRMKLGGPAPDVTHGEDGKETIGHWQCPPDCSVKIIDAQSGEAKPKKGRTGKRGGSPIHGSPTIGTPDQDGTWPDDPGGGASRFYQTFDCSDDCPVKIIDAQSGQSRSRKGKPRAGAKGSGWGMSATGAEYEDEGGASRFYRVFYCAKPAKREKEAGCESLPKARAEEMTGRKSGSAGLVMQHTDGRDKANPYAGTSGQQPRANRHPTVKPVALMRYLVRMVTPRGGLVLDTFAGSGTTGVAAILEGMRFLGIEKDEEGEGYVEIARARCAHAAKGDHQPARKAAPLVLHWSGSEGSWKPPEDGECGWCGERSCYCCPECGNVTRNAIDHLDGCSRHLPGRRTKGGG